MGTTMTHRALHRASSARSRRSTEPRNSGPRHRLHRSNGLGRLALEVLCAGLLLGGLATTVTVITAITLR